MQRKIFKTLDLRLLAQEMRHPLSANHPSLKPQSFMRQLVYASLPLGEGVVLDPFAGSGSTLAACNAVGYESIGIEKDPVYAEMASRAIGPLGDLQLVDPIGPELFDAVAV